jgi:hypothetical protein
MRRIFNFAVLGALALMLAACAANLEKAIVGKYQMKFDSSKMEAKEKAMADAMSGMFSQITLEIKEGGTAEMGAMGKTDSGTWKLDGTKLTVTPKTGKAATFNVEDGGKTLVADAEAMGMPKDQMKGAVVSFKKVEK